MIYFERLDTAEVAKKLGVSKSCVKTQKSLGLERIRKRLGVTKQQYDDNCNKFIERIKNSKMGTRMLNKLYGLNTNAIDAIKKGTYLRRNL